MRKELGLGRTALSKHLSWLATNGLIVPVRRRLVDEAYDKGGRSVVYWIPPLLDRIRDNGLGRWTKAASARAGEGSRAIGEPPVIASGPVAPPDGDKPKKLPPPRVKFLTLEGPKPRKPGRPVKSGKNPVKGRPKPRSE
jgi:hypothetical protein